MNKQENIADTGQLRQSEFSKWLGDSPAMHETASSREISSYLRCHPGDFHLFAVPREYPVCNFRQPASILLKKSFSFSAQPGEFFVFQIAVWSPRQALHNLRITNPDSLFAWRCFNLSPEKILNLPGHSIQPLWIGLEIPKDTTGSRSLQFQILTDNFPPAIIDIPLTISGEVLPDGGVGDDFRMARLRWLDSDIVKAGSVFPPYQPLRRERNRLYWLGHSLELSDCGLPAAITSSYSQCNRSAEGPARQLLSAPVNFISADGSAFSGELQFTEESPARISWRTEGSICGIPAQLNASLTFDGTVFCQLLLHPERPERQSFNLEIEHLEAKLFMGLGRHGGPAPEGLDWCWDRRFWQDGYWTGNTSGGLKVRLLDHDSKPPLVNAYYHFSPLHLPEAWHNGGRGGIRLMKTAPDHLSARLFSGNLECRPGQELDFSFQLQISPFHPAEQERFFLEHFYHPMMHSFELKGSDPLENADMDDLRKQGVTCLNIHHAVGMNPMIGYPFADFSLKRLQTFVSRAHARNLKVILYYTIRELSVHCPEFWALRSLGDEIFFPGDGSESRPCTNPDGPHPWLNENLGRDFLPAWAEVIKNGEMAGNIDLSLITVPGSRLENLYLEGLNYLLDRVPLDGLYLDDSALSPEGFQRLRRIFLAHGNPRPILDFHAWNPFPFDRKRDFGSCSVLYRDMEKLPYFSDLWLGEAFDYDRASPEYYLTEICGLPFGLTGEMLRGGGNPWRGILFGMTARLGWAGDPRPLWDFFQDFGTDGLQYDVMTEFPCEFRADKELKCTRFTNRQGRTAYAIASWNQETARLKTAVSCRIPEIRDFQQEQFLATGEAISIAPGKGIILIPVQSEK